MTENETAPAPAVLMCSKCEKNPRANPDSTNPWCAECKAEKHKEYLAGLKKQNAEQSFARGVAGMRELLGREFDIQGSGCFSGYEIANLIRCARGPQFAD